MNRYAAARAVRRLGWLGRLVLGYRVRRAELWPQCDFEATDDWHVFVCRRCRVGIQLDERDAAIVRRPSGRIAIHRDCFQIGAGDRAARVLQRLGVRKTPACKCSERQAALNAVWFFITAPLTWCHNAGARLGGYLRRRRNA